MGKRDDMKRLPGAEIAAPWSEAPVFGALALAGVIAILFATASYARYVTGRESMVAALEGRSAPEAAVPINAGLTSPTNVTPIETKAAVAADPNKV